MVIPIGCGNDTMFEPEPFILSTYIEQCKSTYGVHLGLIGSLLIMEAMYAFFTYILLPTINF